MKNSIFLRSFFIFFLPLFLLACSSEDKSKHPEDSNFLKKITANLVLEVVSPRVEYYAGEANQDITFRLKNLDLKTVTIQDWKLMEADNIDLFYAPCPPGKSDMVAENEWIKTEKQEKNTSNNLSSRRMPLYLNPNNAAVITVPLTFLKKIQPVTNGTKQCFALKAKINLKTLSTESRIFEIQVK